LHGGSHVFRAYLTTELDLQQRRFSLEVGEKAFLFMQAVIAQKPEPMFSELLVSRKRLTHKQEPKMEYRHLRELLVAADKCMITRLQDRLEVLVAERLGHPQEAEVLIAYAGPQIDALVATRLAQKWLPPVAQKLVHEEKYASAVAHVMQLRNGKFDVAELLQCVWQCERRNGRPTFTITFEADGSCLVVHGRRQKRSSYEIRPNTYRSGHGADNDIMLQINADELKSDEFWCTGRSTVGNCAPTFVQCWQHETDFVPQCPGLTVDDRMSTCR